MINKIYIKGNDKNYPPAIRRFLKYVFNKDSSLLEKESVLDNSTVLIDEDSPVDKDWLDFFTKYSNTTKVILGISRKSNEVYVNLLDLSHIKINFQTAIHSRETGTSPLLFIRNIEQKITSLFKAHGEKSIFDLLNKTRQAICNAPELIKNDLIDWKEYKESYIISGIKNWEAFKKRFNKYKDYLEVCGFDNEIDEVESNINNIQKYIDKLRSLTKDQVNRLNEDEIPLNADHLKNIDHVLTKIKQKIDSIYNDE